MKKRRRSSGALPELPETMIQHIQSYMSGKEAARTTLLSKSWHTAWLTRPSLEFDAGDFYKHGGLPSLEEYTTKTMQRYQHLSLNIHSFKLRSHEYNSNLEFHNLIVKAMNLGANDVDVACARTLPQRVLASQNLLRLSLTWCRVIDGSIVNICCPRLKSLTLNDVKLRSDDVFYKILASCSASIEELSLSHILGLSLSRMRMYELRKLRTLALFWMDVGSLFSSDFASRFPCMRDLSIHRCNSNTRIEIANCTSLQTISYKKANVYSRSAEFDVPNIRKFTYSGGCLPSKLSIKAAASREWEFDVSVSCDKLYDSKWFLKLKNYLAKYRLSRISLCVSVTKSVYKRLWLDNEQEVEIEVSPKPLVVDNLIIDGPSSYLCALLVRLFGICRPKFITTSPDNGNASLDFLCKRQSMFGQFGLKEVKVESLPSDASQTPANKQKIRYKLIWEDDEEEEDL